MTRLIRCRRISGRATETRRCAPGQAIAAALVASFAVLAIGGVSWLAPTGSVFAQTPGTSGRFSFNLFTGDSVDLNPKDAQRLIDAARKAKTPGNCPLGALFIFTPEGDPLFQKVLADVRRHAVLQILQRNGVDATRFFVDSLVGGKKNDATLDLRLDQAKPTLTTTSVPPKGKKVKAGDKITVTMVARDDAEPKAWQTGIKTIQLVAESEGGRFIASENYEACTDPRVRRVEATYTVPANPPPIVRLAALAEDHVGLMDTDLGEFPTGDWHGRIDWWIPNPNSRLWGRLDLTFDYDGKGNLTGRTTGDSHVESPARGEFCGMTTQTPAKLSANLVGQYTPGRNTMSLRVADPHFEQGQFSMCAIGPGGGPLHMSGQPFGGSGPLGQPGLAQLLNSLTVRADGSVEASGEWPVAPAEAQSTLHMKLTLRKAQN